MNLFNFLRFKNIEPKTNDFNVVYRVAEKKNGKFVLVDDSGKVVTDEFDNISSQISHIRIGKNNDMFYYIQKAGTNEASVTALPREKSDDKFIYATASEDGISQVFMDGFGTFLLSDDLTLSKLYSEISKTNKNDLRIAKNLDNTYEIISEKGSLVYEKYDEISKPDENGVRVAKKVEVYDENWWKEFSDEKPQPDSLIYVLSGMARKEKEPKTKTTYALLNKNYGVTNQVYTDAYRFDKDNYIVTLPNGKKEIVNKNGKNIAGGMYYNIEEPNVLGEVVASRTKSKSKGGIVLIHEGKKYKKADNYHKVVDSSHWGVKALKYGEELNKNVVAGVDISKGIEVDENVNRVLIALLKGEKPQPRFWKAIEEQNKFDELAKGVEAYGQILDEIASVKPEFSLGISISKQNLVKHLNTLIKRKIAGHKTYEQTESKKIVEHEENISSSSNKREKLLEVSENFEEQK